MNSKTKRLINVNHVNIYTRERFFIKNSIPNYRFYNISNYISWSLMPFLKHIIIKIKYASFCKRINANFFVITYINIFPILSFNKIVHRIIFWIRMSIYPIRNAFFFQGHSIDISSNKFI